MTRMKEMNFLIDVICPKCKEAIKGTIRAYINREGLLAMSYPGQCRNCGMDVIKPTY